jgi:hypothetical protein
LREYDAGDELNDEARADHDAWLAEVLGAQGSTGDELEA